MGGGEIQGRRRHEFRVIDGPGQIESRRVRHFTFEVRRGGVQAPGIVPARITQNS